MPVCTSKVQTIMSNAPQAVKATSGLDAKIDETNKSIDFYKNFVKYISYGLFASAGLLTYSGCNFIYQAPVNGAFMEYTGTTPWEKKNYTLLIDAIHNDTYSGLFLKSGNIAPLAMFYSFL
jgi:hypothetical protein